MRMPRGGFAVLLVAVVTLAGCSDGAPHQPAEQLTTAPTTASTAGPTSKPPVVHKLLVFVVENHSLEQMRKGMPYTHALASRYGYASDYLALAHPSLPNYLAIAGGDSFGVHDDALPSEHRLRGTSVFGAALRRGHTATTYAEGMEVRCQRKNRGQYVARHNPWTYFVDESADCRRHDVPVAGLDGDIATGRLPAVGMVIPNLCNNAHNCSLSTADAWLESHLRRVFAGADWRSGHLAVVITADEDDSRHGNRILTVVAHPSLHGVVVTKRLDHYSLCRSYTDVVGAAPLERAARSTSLLEAFGLRATARD